MRRTVEILLNLVEELNSKVKDLESENQRLRDENNRLLGEQGKPDIKAKSKKGFTDNHSSEKERQTPKKHSKSSKNESIKINREEILEYPLELFCNRTVFEIWLETCLIPLLKPGQVVVMDNATFHKGGRPLATDSGSRL
jgi:regulator of replication initiation timing